MAFHHQSIQNKMRPCYELAIPIPYIKRYDPLVVGPGKDCHYTSWLKITNNQFINKIKQQALKKPTANLAFQHIAHLAIDAYHIPYSKIDSITKLN